MHNRFEEEDLEVKSYVEVPYKNKIGFLSFKREREEGRLKELCRSLPNFDRKKENSGLSPP